MHKIQLFGLIAALSVVLVACPPTTTPTPPPGQATSNITGTLAGWTRGARTLTAFISSLGGTASTTGG